MPVIQLPQDRRWGDLGQGLGNLIGTVVQGFQQRRVQEGIAKIEDDPAIPADKKLNEAYRQYGEPGIQAHIQRMKAQELQVQMDVQRQQIEASKAAARLSTAEALEHEASGPYAAGLAKAKAEKAAAEAKYAEPQAAATLAGTQAQTGETAARTAALTAAQPYVAPKAAAGAAEAQAQATITGAQAAVAGPKAEADVQAAKELAATRQIETKLKDLELQQQQQMDKFDTTAAFKQLWPGATDEQLVRAKARYWAEKTPHEGLGAMGKYAEELVKSAGTPGYDPEAEIKKMVPNATPGMVAIAKSHYSGAKTHREGEEAVAAYGEGLQKDLGLAAGTPGYDPAVTLRKMVPGATPEQVEGAKAEYAAGKTAREGEARVATYAAGIQKQLAEKPTPQYIEKQAADASAGATSAIRFMNAFDKAPGKIGLLGGATVKAWWEGKGGATGDAALLDMNDAGLLQAADNARQGGGFWSAGRFQMAKDTTATIADSPLRAVINMDQVAERRIAELQSYRKSQPANINMRPIDDAIAQWQEVKLRTSSYQTYATPDQRTVLIHAGSQLDAGNFKTLLDGNKMYPFRDGTQSPGSVVVNWAQANGTDPRVALKEFAAKHGGLK